MKNSVRVCGIGCACLFLIGAGSALAQVTSTNTWTGLGTTDNWSDTGNWSLGTMPDSTDVAVYFTGAVRTNVNIDVADIQVHRLWLTATAGAFTFSGNALEIAGHDPTTTGAQIRFDNTSTNQTVFNNNIIWNATAAGTVNRTIRSNGTGRKLIFNGDLLVEQPLYIGGSSSGKIVLNGYVSSVGTATFTAHGGVTGSVEFNNPTNSFDRFGTSSQTVIFDTIADKGSLSNLGVDVPNKIAAGQYFGGNPTSAHWSTDVSNLAIFQYTGDTVSMNRNIAIASRYQGNIAPTNRGSVAIEVVHPATTLTLTGNLQYDAPTVSGTYGGNWVLNGSGNGILAGNILAASAGNIYSNVSTSTIMATGNRDSAKLWKAGTGTWTLNGTGQVSDVEVEAGKLLLNNTLVVLTNGIVSRGDAKALVDAGGTLGGTGTLSVANGLHIAGGTLSPGNSIGILSVNGDTAFSGGTAAFTVELALDETGDRVQVTGNLDLGSETTLLLSGAMEVDHWYTIATYSGTLSGTFNAIDTSGLASAAGFDIDYGTGSNSAILVMIPEPASMSLLAVAGAALLFRRRIRRE